MKARIALALLLLAALAAVAYQVRSAQRSAEPESLSVYVPQDAMLTIESPDFASLLRQWTNSAESKAWLASDNHAVFQNSRLLGRLTDAQESFAKAAGIPAGADLLNQVAGKESVFAWYDIGKLECLYITHLSAEQASQSELFRARGSFQRRHAGNTDFYVRSSGAAYNTVAFAQAATPFGNLLLLATREDLIANALELIAATSPANSIREEPWFRDATAALPAEKPAPALHMVLNLDRIAFDPHFQTYWIQRNITWTHQFRAAASDLYLEPKRFREERVLLPKSPQPEPASTPDIAALASLAPPSTGVFSAVAMRNSSVAVTAIQEKLLGSFTASPRDPELAPDPSLEATQTGSASDFETRIDTPPPPVSSTASTDELTQVLQTANADAMLTLSSAQNSSEKASLWVPIHSAVVLHTANPANPQTLASALQQTLRGSLTAANKGIEFQPIGENDSRIYSLTGPRPLLFALSSTPSRGNLILLADDQPLLQELLRNLATSPEKSPVPATRIAVFHHTGERASYIRLASLIDGTNNQPSASNAATGLNGNAKAASEPSFFSQNIRSLSDTFAHLQSERIIERTVDSNLRQTVTYLWQAP